MPSKSRFFRRARRASILLSAFALLQGANAHAQFQRGDGFHPPAATLHYARTRDFHDLHLKLVMSISYKNHSAEGDVTHTIVPFRAGLKSIVLDAGSNLKIASCLVNGATARFEHANNFLTITPASPLPKARPATVEVRYTMPNPTSHGGANGSGGFKFIDPSTSDPQRRPGFWTQGESETNRYWVPCYDFPNDKLTSEEIITVQDDWQVIGNGAQGPTTFNKANHTATFRWTMTQPHSTYLLSLVGGEMDIVKDTWQGVPLIYACPKGQGALLKDSFGNTPDMLQFFSDVLGVKYPWPKYAQSYVYDFPGGMENVSATTLGGFGGLTDRRTGLFRIADLTSHELAHQWFGDLVTCQDWGDVWLNESFATFFANLYEEHLRGRGGYEDITESTRQGYLRARNLHALSTQMYANSDVMFDSTHTYSKGGVILHMMRRQLGDEDFFRSLGHYLKVNGYKPVDAHDLEKAIEETTGRNMKPFFDQWIFKPGHPILSPSWSYDEATKSVTVTVKQVQETTDGTPIYDIPLTIGLLRNRDSAAGHLERVVVQLNKETQEFHIPADTKPDALMVDPDHDLLREMRDVNWTDDQIPVILRYAPFSADRRYALGRIQAGPNLTEDQLNQLYADTLKAEYNDGIASMLLMRLGNSGKEQFRQLFRDQLKSRRDERRPAALEALSKLPATPEDTVLFHNIGLSDTEPYAVVDAAMQALARINFAANQDVYKHQLAAHTLRDRMAMRAVGIASGVTSEAATSLLVTAATGAYPARVRSEAISDLEDRAPDSTAIHDALVKVLTADTVPSAQLAAIKAIENRKDKAAVAALRALAGRSKDAAVKEAAKTTADTLEKN